MKKREAFARIVFITGTGTGVGKTLLTGLLLHHLRQDGIHARAVKPFCSGGTHDVSFLRQIQDGELREREVCPFYFREPIAPLIAQRIHREFVALPKVLDHLRRVAASCEVLLVEGSGGVLVPLGEGYSVADLIASLDCQTMIVASNKLGTINHTLLTVRYLQNVLGIRKGSAGNLKVVLMDLAKGDESSGSNGEILREFLAPVQLVQVPFLGLNACSFGVVKKSRKKIAKTLASILD